MKTSLATVISVLALLANPAKAFDTPPHLTTEQFSLQCAGKMKVTQLEPVVIEKKQQSTRNPEPSYYYVTTGLVHFEIIEASKGCTKAQKTFGLVFQVETGKSMKAVFNQYGQLSQEAMLAAIQKVSEFKFEQEFPSALLDGTLPFFPLFHAEYVELVTDHPSYTLTFDLNGETTLNKIFQYVEGYGLKDPKTLSTEEKFLMLEKILAFAKTLDLTQPDVLTVLAKALSSYDPNQYSSHENFDLNKKYIQLVLPLLEKVTLMTAELKGANPGVVAIYNFLHYKIMNSYLTYQDVPVDLNLFVATLEHVPLILQVNTSSPNFLSQQNVEMFLTAFKKNMLDSTFPKEKAQQYKKTVTLLKEKFLTATSASQFPLSAQSLILVEEILSL